MRDSSSVHNGGPNVIDQLPLDKLLAIINGVEYFADGQWRSGVLTDKPEALLQLRGNRILEPEQMIRLEALSQARRFDRRVFFRWLIVHFAAANAVCALQSRYAALRTNRFISKFDVIGGGFNRFFDILTAGVAVHQHRLPGSASQQLIDWRIQGLALDVPERGIDRGNRTHRHWAAAPVRAFIEVLPDVLDSPSVASDQKWNDMVGEIACNRKLTAV